MAVLFVLFAALQFNDPDPYFWIMLYLYAAYLCVNRFRGKYQPRAYALAILVYTTYAVYLFFDKNGVLSWLTNHHAESLVTTMKAEKPWIEESREFGGLMIIIISIGLNWIIKPKNERIP
ncbi:MAG: hypothetical protein RL335_1152 [Bacteroidota bacterium]|jgi:hypothetical protein